MDQLIDILDITRRAVRGHAHHFIFAFVDFEAQESGKSRIEQADRMGKTRFGKKVYLIFAMPIPIGSCPAKRGRCPFPHTVHR